MFAPPLAEKDPFAVKVCEKLAFVPFIVLPNVVIPAITALPLVLNVAPIPTAAAGLPISNLPL